MLQLGTSESQRTVMGIGVPVAPSFLDLEEEETIAYDARAAAAVSLPALLAQCAVQSPAASRPPSHAPVTPSDTPSGIRPRESFHTVPRFPNDSSPDIEVTGESNLHEMPLSKPPPGIVAPSARPRSTRRRSFFAKFLFVMIATAVALAGASRLSAAGKIPRIDARPLLTKGISLVKEKIPWDRLPKLPRH